MIAVSKFLIIIICLLTLYGCEVLGEDEDSSSKQMILIGAIEPSNTFLNNKPEEIQLDTDTMAAGPRFCPTQAGNRVQRTASEV